MKYKEFEKKIEDWGKTHSYVTEVGFQQFYTYIKIYTGIKKEINTIASIGNKYQYVIDTNWVSFNKIKNHARGELLDILVELAKTPIEDRKDEKKYYLRLSIFGYDDEQNYLNLEHDTGKYLFGSKKNTERYQPQFTQKEIEKLREEYNLDSFEVVEVEE